MSTDKVDLLPGLLAGAIEATVIRHWSRREQMDISLYRNYLSSCWDMYSPDVNRYYVDRFDAHIADPAIERGLLAFVTSTLAEHIHEDRIQTATIEILGGSHPGVQTTELLQQLLKVALVRGPYHAAQSFHRAVEGGPTPYQRIALLNGIRVENEIEVCTGIRLVPLPSSTSKLPNLFPHMNYMSPVDLLGRTIIVIEYTVSPTFLNPRVTTTTIDNSFKHTPLSAEHPDFNVEEFCDALSMACNGSIEYIAMWTHLSSDHIFNIMGMGGGHHFKPFSLHDVNRTPVIEDDARKALHIYESRKALGEDAGKKLKVSIDRWIKSKGDQSLEDSMIDLGIALEALFLSDSDRHSELSYRLRLRAAWYLGKDLDERRFILGDVNRLYGKRSTAVHGGDIPFDVATKKLLDRGQELCLQAILRTIRNGSFPDWNGLVLGEES